MKVKFWTCGNCGHEEPITDNDLQELNPVVSSAGAIKSAARTVAPIRSVNRLTVLVWVGRSWWYAHISERGRSRGR